jgi:hypothetical protein
MAKAYSFVDIPQPLNLAAVAVAGGTLAVRTWYYTVQCVYSAGAVSYTWEGKSLPSIEIAVTTTSGNQSVQLTFDVSKGAAGAYRIFRSTTPGGAENTACLTAWPTDAAHNVAGVVTWVDNGYAGHSNSYLETKSKPHGRLTISGSASGDQFSIVDLYNADVAAGWGVIQKLDEDTFRVNTYLIANTQYWADKDKVIILGDAAFFTGSHITLGEISSGITNKGCKLIIKSSWLCSLYIQTLNAYLSTFEYVFPTVTQPGLGLAQLFFYAGTIRDCFVKKLRVFTPLHATNCILKNVRIVEGASGLGTMAGQLDGIQVLGGQAAFQTSTNTILNARNVYTQGFTIWGAVLVVGKNAQITFIDSIFAEPFNNALVDSTGTWIKDCFSFNMRVNDGNGDPIENSRVVIEDKDSIIVHDTMTDASGLIEEQIVVRQLATVDNLTVTTTQRGPFKLIISIAGYETYIEYFDPVDSSAIVKTVGLKTAIDTMPILGGGIALRVDPTNSTVDRDVLIKP